MSWLSNQTLVTLLQPDPPARFFSCDQGSRWAGISSAAKECIRGMLEPNPAARPTATQVRACCGPVSCGPLKACLPPCLPADMLKQP